MILNIDISNLNLSSPFSSDDLYLCFIQNGFNLSKSTFYKHLESMIRNGTIQKVGREAYAIADKCTTYSHDYSDISKEIASTIKNNFPFIRFSIFETSQLNEFLNHLLAHNTIFVSVEQDGLETVFEMLKDTYPGSVLFKPDVMTYNIYWKDSIIIVNKLVSESPKGLNISWHARLEMIMVDLISNKLFSSIVQKDELINVYENILDKYTIDNACLNRYAKRRKAVKKLIEFIGEDKACDLGVIA